MVLEKLGQIGEGRRIRRLQEVVEAVNALEETVTPLSDADLAARTVAFRERLAAGETLDEILPEAFATVREAARRTIGQRHFDVQLMGGIVLHGGSIAEMRTGEGKTLTSTLATYLNALAGSGVHVASVATGFPSGQTFTEIKLAETRAAVEAGADETITEERLDAHSAFGFIDRVALRARLRREQEQMRAFYVHSEKLAALGTLVAGVAKVKGATGPRVPLGTEVEIPAYATKEEMWSVPPDPKTRRGGVPKFSAGAPHFAQRRVESPRPGGDSRADCLSYPLCRRRHGAGADHRDACRANRAERRATSASVDRYRRMADVWR